jgi:hypothetical protein
VRRTYEGSLFGEHGAEHLQDLALAEFRAEWIGGARGLREPRIEKGAHVSHAGAGAVVDDDGVGEEDERRVVWGTIGRSMEWWDSALKTREFYVGVGVWAQSFSFISFLCSKRRRA